MALHLGCDYGVLTVSDYNAFSAFAGDSSELQQVLATFELIDGYYYSDQYDDMLAFDDEVQEFFLENGVTLGYFNYAKSTDVFEGFE